MRRSTSSKTGGSPSKSTTDLLSTMSSATQNNARVRSDLQSMQDKVDSARRHLNTHNRHFHTKGEDSSSGESNENRSPLPPRRSRSSPRDANALNVLADTAVRARSRDKATPSVLYPAELKYVRRASREGGGGRRSGMHDTTLRSSPAKSISPAKSNSSFLGQSHLPNMTSPRRRSTYVVSGQPRDSHFSLRGDLTFTVGRRDTALIDRRDSTTVSHDATVIAPGLLEDEYHPTSRKKQRTTTSGHGSTSIFHARCTPNTSHRPMEEVSNAADWEVQFLPGSMRNARMVESNRRSAAVDLLTPNAEAVLYQEERTRRQEEELKRLAREQMNGRSAREIFDNWVPLHEEKRRMEREKEGREDKGKKSTRRLWESADGGGILEGMARRDEEGGGGESRRVVEEDEAGYAMPLPRDVLLQPAPTDLPQLGHRNLDTTVPLPSLRTPSPAGMRGPSPDEQYFTPATTVKRLSRVEEGGERGGGEWRDMGETPILGRHSTRLSSTFVMERSTRRLRGGADKDADRSAGSSLWPTPDRREISIDGGNNRSIEGGVNRSIGEYATPIGRRTTERRREEDGEEEMEGETSFLNASHNQSRTGLNESMHAFERSLNRSLDTLSDLASRLSSQLEASKANLSSMEPIGEEEEREKNTVETKQVISGDRRLGMEASILDSLPPMRDERQTVGGGGEELRIIMSSSERDRRSSLPERTKREEEKERRIERITSPIPRPRTLVPSSHSIFPPSSLPPSSIGLSSLLDASIGRMERSEKYEREAERLAGVVNQVNQAEAQKEKERREKSIPIPIPRSRPIPTPLPLPRSRSPSTEVAASAAGAAPMPQLAIDTAGGREELMEMYEARHRNWHRRGDDIPVPSPRASISRSPSPLPLALPNPAELRERQSKKGMLDQRAKAVGGAFLHLLRRLYKTRFERRYEEKREHAGDPAREAVFAEEQKREVEAFKREAEEAKRRAVDEGIRYRDFMQWLKEESERMEKEIEFEVERRERRRWERKNGGQRREEEEQSILDSSRFLERERLLDERAKRAMRTTMAAKKYAEKRENVRRLEHDARKAVAFAEIPSSARSSIDDSSFILNHSTRRYSMGNEPLRVTSARGNVAETSMNASRDVKSRDVSQSGSEEKEEEERKKKEEEKIMRELREKLEERRRQAESVRRAMETSQKELTENEVLSVAAQLTAHDQFIHGVEEVGRVIGQNVQPHSPRFLPPGVEPLDLSSLDDEEKEKKEEKSGMSSLIKSTAIDGGHTGQRSSLSSDSLDVRSSLVSSIPSKKSTSDSTKMTSSTSSSSSSSTSSNKTLNAVEELSRRLEQITVEEEEKEKNTVEEEPQFSPLRDLDRSLPSTVVSTGRQEITVDTVPQIDTVAEPTEEEESIPEEIVKEESTVATKPLFSPLESSTSLSEESSEISEEKKSTVEGGVKKEEERKESIEEKGLSSSEEEEKEMLDVSTASLKKAISVASEMADPFDGFESSSGSRKSVERGAKKENEKEKSPHMPPVVLQPAAIVPAAAAASMSTSTTLTTTSTDQMTVIEMAARRDEVDEISWGGSEGGLEVGGGTSERSADFDWGSSVDRQTTPKDGEKKKEEEEEKKKKDEGQAPPLPMASHRSEISSGSGEEEGREKRGKFASLRDRLSKINTEDEEEKKSEKQSSSTITTSSSSTARSSSDSTSTSSTEESKTSEETEESNGKEEKEEEVEEDDGEKTPRVVSSTGGVSSASGSIDFDDDVPIPVDSTRTPRVPSATRFRLSLDDSFPDSPRDAPKPVSTLNGRVMSGGGGGGGGGVSPRGTPTSPHTPRAHLLHSSSISSPTAHPLTSPDARKSRFSTVMPSSPRSGRRSTSPKNFSLSREASFLIDDSSLGDISRLSQVELPNRETSGGVQNFPPILSSLPPITPSFPPISSSSSPLRPSLCKSMEDENEVLDESVSFLMDVKSSASVLSSLPIAELIGDTKEEEKETVSPPLTLTARTSNGALHEQCVALGKQEFIQPRIEKEVEQIWKIVEKKGYYTPDDTKEFEEMDVEEEDGEEITVLRNERIRLIRGVSTGIAASLFPRDLRMMENGGNASADVIPLRRMKLTPSKERLREAIEKELMMDGGMRASAPHIRRMLGLGIQFESLPPEDRILYSELYSREEQLFNSDAERLEILDILMGL